MKENEQRLFYEKLKKEELIDIILEFEDSDKKDAEIYEYQNSKIKKLQKENENLKEQLNKADKKHFNNAIKMLKETNTKQIKQEFILNLSGRQITKLAEYEDTGLTPQGIIELRDDAIELFKENKELKAIVANLPKE